jgi:hypothetical protein
MAILGITNNTPTHEKNKVILFPTKKTGGKIMEITTSQKNAILESVQKLDAIAYLSSVICEGGTPTDEIICGYKNLLYGICEEIRQILSEDKTT